MCFLLLPDSPWHHFFVASLSFSQAVQAWRQREQSGSRKLQVWHKERALESRLWTCVPISDMKPKTYVPWSMQSHLRWPQFPHLQSVISDLKRNNEPWLVWLSGLSTGKPKGHSFNSVRAHAWVVGQVPSRGRRRGNHTLMFLSLLSPLSKNKVNKIFKRKEIMVIKYLALRQAHCNPNKYWQWVQQLSWFCCVCSTFLSLWTWVCTSSVGMLPRWALAWMSHPQPSLSPLMTCPPGPWLTFPVKAVFPNLPLLLFPVYLL